jgi:hypothetical protein
MEFARQCAPPACESDGGWRSARKKEEEKNPLKLTERTGCLIKQHSLSRGTAQARATISQVSTSLFLFFLFTEPTTAASILNRDGSTRRGSNPGRQRAIHPLLPQAIGPGHLYLIGTRNHKCFFAAKLHCEVFQASFLVRFVKSIKKKNNLHRANSFFFE